MRDFSNSDNWTKTFLSSGLNSVDLRTRGWNCLPRNFKDAQFLNIFFTFLNTTQNTPFLVLLTRHFLPQSIFAFTEFCTALL